MKKIFLAVLILSAALFFLMREKDSGIYAVAEQEDISGHQTIGISEKDISATGDMLFFSQLGSWNFNRENKTECPEPLIQRSGKKASCTGFMYPLESGAMVKNFCLLRTTQTCCYGPKPQYNQYILVEMKEKVRFERLTPVAAEGIFFVDPRPDDGYIYRMEASAVFPVSDPFPQQDIAVLSEKEKLPVLDLNLLEMQRTSETVISEILFLEGKVFLLSGYLSDFCKNPASVLVSKNFWDRSSKGIPPDIFSAVTVFPVSEKYLPPVWKERAVFKGTVRVEKDPEKWKNKGIVWLEKAEIPGRKGFLSRVKSIFTGE